MKVISKYHEKESNAVIMHSHFLEFNHNAWTLSHVTIALRYNKTLNSLKSHYIRKRFFMQFSISDNDVLAGKNNRRCPSIHLCHCSLRFGKLRRGNRFLKGDFNEITSCKSTRETIPYFGFNDKKERKNIWGSTKPWKKEINCSSHKNHV